MKVLNDFNVSRQYLMLKHTISILYYQSVLKAVFGSYITVAAFSIVLGFFVYAVTRKVQGNSAGSGLLSEERADIKLRGIHS